MENMTATEDLILYLSPFLLIYGNPDPNPEQKDRKHLLDAFKIETRFSLVVVVTGLNVTMYDNLRPTVSSCLLSSLLVLDLFLVDL